MAVLTEDIVHLVLQEMVKGRMSRRVASSLSLNTPSPDAWEALRPWPYSEVRACALVCRTWLNPARRLLYNGIRISSDKPTAHCQVDRLRRTLIESPSLAGLVRVVWLLADVDGGSASDLLHSMPRLEEVHLLQQAIISLEVKPLQQKSLKILHLKTEIPVHLAKILPPLAPTLERLFIHGPHPITGAETLSFKSLNTLMIVQRGQDTPATADLALFHDSPILHDLRIAYDGPPAALKNFIKHFGSQITSFQCHLASPVIRCDLWPDMRNLLHLTLDDEVEVEDIPHLPKHLHTLKICNLLWPDTIVTLLELLTTPAFLPCLKAIPYVADVDAEDYSNRQVYEDDKILAPEDIVLRDRALLHLKDVRKLPFMTETLESASIWDVDPASGRSWSPGSNTASHHSYEPGCECDECQGYHDEYMMDEMYETEEWEKDDEYLEFLDSQFGASMAGRDDW